MAQDQRDYYSAKYQNLEDIPEVGPATAEKLRALGYKTVESLATAPLRELTQGGIGEITAQKIIRAARQTLALEFITGTELVEQRKDQTKMTSGCLSLDALLEGGLETQSITEFYGEFGSGKSQVCQQLAVSVQLPENEGGLDGACLYIDTEGIFRPDRVMEMAEFLGLDPLKALNRIVFAEAYNSDHQTLLLESADEVIKEHGVRCIIVDSLTGHFRSDYIGRATLADRQQKLNKHMHKLIRLSRSFNAVAAVTNQVTATPDMFASRDPLPIGGHIVGHIAHTRIYLKKGRDNLRIAKTVASPFLPIGERPFRITDRGIEGQPDDPEEPEEPEEPEKPGE